MDIKRDKENNIPEYAIRFSQNKEIPKILEQIVLQALSHYPELLHTRIRFRFSQKLKKSVMAARPVLRTLFQRREKRRYTILINPVFKLTQHIEPIHHLPTEVLIGWVGHELGHIMDYERRTTWGIASFGLLYWLSKRFIRKAERAADTFAVHRGMAPFILSTKEFILQHSYLSVRYKDKIARLYLSPDDIIEIVARLEQETPLEREKLLATDFLLK